MKKVKDILYISAALLLAACASDDAVEPTAVSTLSSDGEKTPINVVTNLTTGVSMAQTRAVNKKFEANDQLLAYIQTVTSDMAEAPATPTYTVGTFKGLKTFTISADADNTDGGANITATSALTPTIYWDDYSSTSYDLRDANKYLQLKYGYCYNGGTPTTALNATDGTLGWTVATDQSSGFKTSDLLWANTQEPVHYVHGTAKNSAHGTLTLPYTHAMSKITIRLQLGTGYSASEANFSGNVVTLKSKNTVAELTAPTAGIEASNPQNITMHMEAENEANMDYSYAALFVPSQLTVGDELAEISSIHGNKYTVSLTSEMLTAWDAKLETVSTNKFTKPGVNYLLTVSITKQQITVSATLADWDEVTATGTGLIQFANDVTTTGSIATSLQTDGFEVYQLLSGGMTTNANYGAKVTELTYGGSPAEWTYTPMIYWPNGTDQYFFRAISPRAKYDSSTGNIDWSQTTEDVLWATTAAADSYAEGAAQKPRTGDVPLTFKHLKSKISVTLATSGGADGVTLTGAKISLTNLASNATFSLHDATVTPSTQDQTIWNARVVDAEYKIENYLAVPQTIPNTARLIVKLADNTTYSLQLNQCVVTGGSTPVAAWESNKLYKYTITVLKEAITFRVMVNNWVEVHGSGDANLEWD